MLPVYQTLYYSLEIGCKLRTYALQRNEQSGLRERAKLIFTIGYNWKNVYALLLNEINWPLKQTNKKTVLKC